MPPKTNRVLDRKLAIARKVIIRLRRKLGSNLIAAGLSGSVGRGTAEKYSDIDFLLIVRKAANNLPRFMIVDDNYCSLGFETWDRAIRQLTQPSHELPELLGGFTGILPIYDPQRLLPKLETRARKVPADVFRKSAELALLHSYEDFCRVKNAYLKGDRMVLKDNVLGVTHSAALVVASINRTSFPSDRMIFKAHREFSKLPDGFHRIEKLRYGNLQGERLFSTFLGFYLDLIDFAGKEGISFPVSRQALEELDP